MLLPTLRPSALLCGVVLKDFEADRIQFVNYACGYLQDFWSKDPICRRVDCLWKDSVRDTRLIEIEVRDNMQPLAGQSSLEKSKKSIQISTYHIQEGKRGKWSWFQMRDVLLTQR